MAAPRIMPAVWLTKPSVTTLKTRPSALICADDPAEVGSDDAERGQHFDRAVVAQAEIVAEGQDVQLVELLGEEEAGDDQAQRGAEGIGDDAAQAVLDEGGGDAEHCLGAEPRGEHGGGDDRQRQMAAGDGEILRRVHAGGDVEADADRQHQVEDHEPDEHAAPREQADQGALIIRRAPRPGPAPQP